MMEKERLTAEDLVKMFETSEDASTIARENSERDRDYYDGVQYSAEELAAFKKRKQPTIVVNRIKRKIDFLKGYETTQRIKPRVLPRTMQHEAEAEGAEQALRYVADEQRFPRKRSRVWDNLLIEGMAGYRVYVEKEEDGIVEVKIDVVPWDRMFYDPHSSASDFSDAGYIGLVRWFDLDEAMRLYPDNASVLTEAVASSTLSGTYEDKPKYSVWGDAKRRRVRACQIWVRKGDEWHFAEFTKGGILKAGVSPYQDEDGGTDCELVFGSAYVSRDNERYGIVREMIGPQDEINKRRSKSLHLLNTNQVIAEEGAVRDVEKARREMARPDAWVTISPGYSDKINIQTRLDLANGHMQLMQQAGAEIDMIAGNVALQGNAAQDAASGRAIIASQQGGAMEIAPLLDALRDMDLRLFRAVWNRIRQFWDQERWVRVTDDERNVKWLGINVDPVQAQMLSMQGPEVASKIAGVVPSIAQLDVDIIIDEAPDGITSQMEQFQAIVQLKQMDANGELPFRAIMQAMPNLRNKDQIMAAMDQASQAAQQNPALQLQLAQAQVMLQKAQADAANAAAGAQLRQAQTAKTYQEAQLEPQKVAADLYKPIDIDTGIRDHEMAMQKQAMNNDHDMQKHVMKMQFDADQKERDRMIKAQSMAQKGVAQNRNQERA